MAKPKTEEGRGRMEDLRKEKQKGLRNVGKSLWTPVCSSHQNLKWYQNYFSPIMSLLSVCVCESQMPSVLSLILVWTGEHNVNLSL